MNNEVASLMNNEKRIILVNFRRRKLILLYSGGASPSYRIFVYIFVD